MFRGCPTRNQALAQEIAVTACLPGFKAVFDSKPPSHADMNTATGGAGDSFPSHGLMVMVLPNLCVSAWQVRAVLSCPLLSCPILSHCAQGAVPARLSFLVSGTHRPGAGQSLEGILGSRCSSAVEKP